MILPRIVLSFLFVFVGMQALAGSANVERGKQVYDELSKKYSDIMQPMIWGIATETPVLSVCVPDTAWKKLDKKEKVDLTFYLESLIPGVRNNPDSYLKTYSNSPMYSTFRSRAENLCDDCWAIQECIWDSSRNRWGLERVLVQGDTPWNQDDSSFRGISASELRTQ